MSDCSGNAISTENSARFGTASLADSFDVVINEILFNPRSNGVDYVEIYNNSKKIIDLKNIYIANRNTAGAISSIAFNQELAPAEDEAKGNNRWVAIR